MVVHLTSTYFQVGCSQLLKAVYVTCNYHGWIVCSSLSTLLTFHSKAKGFFSHASGKNKYWYSMPRWWSRTVNVESAHSRSLDDSHTCLDLKCLVRRCVLLVLSAKTDHEFKAFLDERNPKQQHSSTLESYLIKPIQRVLKYPLLLKELYSLTDPDSEEHYHLDGKVQKTASIIEENIQRNHNENEN